MSVYFHDATIRSEVTRLNLDKALDKTECQIRERGFTIARQIKKGDNYAYLSGSDSNGYHFVGSRYTSSEFPNDEVFCFFALITPDEAKKKRGGQLDVLVEKFERAKIISDAELHRWLKEELDKQKPPMPEPVPKPSLPDRYIGWINPSVYKTIEEKDLLKLVVLETKKWRENIGSSGASSRLSEIRSKLATFYCDEMENDGEIIRIPNTDFYKIFLKNSATTVLCNYQNNDYAEKGRKLTLIGLYLGNEGQVSNAEELNTWLCNQCAAFEAKSPDLFPCGKAYPGILLYEEAHFDKWCEIEKKNDNSNLEMSDEEMNVLKSITSRPECLPTFINGSAGSGKSTILYYLFWHFWMQRKATPQQFLGDMLFLTLSKELLEEAKKTIGIILRLDPDNSNLEQSEIEENIKGCFLPFKNLLRKIVGDNNSRKYDGDREINFERFRSLILNDTKMDGGLPRYPFGKKLPSAYPPELCWHIIRSFIKGYSIESFLSPEDFRALPRQLKDSYFIEDSAYQYVFEEVWPWYKKVTFEGMYWDQQDLAREALDLLLSKSYDLPNELNHFTAIFCDEAQDLTGIELQIVQRMSCLVKYDLSSISSSPSVPFVFAGDPLQTLNPSGFRWQDLKSNVYRNIMQPLGVQPRLETQELSMNYRSPSEIIYLANLVQLSRKMLFDDPIEPQEPFDENRPGTPIYYPFDKNAESPLSESQIRSYKGSVILLPCSDGEEVQKEFISKYGILRQLKANDPGLLFMSVITAKGLDISNVVVFAFGDYLFSDRLFPTNTDGACKDIALSYALNKVYVALTRSKDQLLILDTKEGAENFWNILDKQKGVYLEKLAEVKGREYKEKWRDLLPRDNIEMWKQRGQFLELDDAKLKEQADGFYNSAKLRKDPGLMERAANFYRRIGEHDLANACKAFAAMYRCDYANAAKQFSDLRVRDRDQYCDEEELCYWNARNWAGLLELDPRPSPKHLAVAKLMSSTQLTPGSLQEFLSNEDREPDDEPQWREVEERLCDFVIKEDYEKDIFTADVLLGLAKYLHEIGEANPNCINSAFILFVFVGRKFKKENAWQKADGLFSLISRDARNIEKFVEIYNANRGKWPLFLRACIKIKDYSLGYERWKKEISDPVQVVKDLGSDNRALVYDVLQSNNKLPEAIKLALDVGDCESLKKLSDIRGFDNNLNTTARIQFLKLLCEGRSSRWDLIYSQSDALLATAKADSFNDYLDIVGQNPETFKNEPQPHDIIARKILDKIQDFLNRRLWPSDAKDLRRSAAAFESIGLNKYMSDYGRLLLKTYTSGEWQVISIAIFVRGRRLWFENKFDPSIQRETRDYLEQQCGQGIPFEKFWNNGVCPFEPIPNQDSAATTQLTPPIDSHQAHFDSDNQCWCLKQSPLEIEVYADETFIRNRGISRTKGITIYHGTREKSSDLSEDAGISVEFLDSTSFRLRHRSWANGVWVVIHK